jgi:23S rRNA pseudouridine1911/1915/1917 synthase
MRLDQFLSRTFEREEAAPSRAELQRWIEAGRVTIDGVVGKASAKLRAGAEVSVRPAPPATTTALPDASVVFDVLYKDDDLIVVDKPAGLVVHPARGHESGTLVNGLLGRGLLVESPEEEGEFARPGIVHRIDKGTSGILVVARTPRAREGLKTQFSSHTIEREYEAIAVGAVKSGTFDTLHGRHPQDRLRFTTKVSTGKRAVTHVRVLSATPLVSHVVCRLETGRTHQIRVHLAESGHPILGDPLYGRPPRDPALRAVSDALGRQALHARVLGFVHPVSGELMRFESPVPEDFQRALAAVDALCG